MKLLHFSFSLLIVFLMSACDPSGGGGEAQPSDSDTISIRLENADNKDSLVTRIFGEDAKSEKEPADPSAFIILDDPNHFPYLKPLTDNTIYFEAWKMKFTMKTPEFWGAMTPENTPWIQEHDPQQNLGVYVTYVFKNRPLSLNEVQIRMDYIGKTMPGYTDMDSIFSAFKGFYMKEMGSYVLKKRHTVTTHSKGKNFEVIEAYCIRDVQYSPKYHAYAYMFINDEHVLAVHLDAVDEFEFKDALPMFYELLGSFSL